MPVPIEYKRAGDDFYAFLLDVRDRSDLWSTHVTYTMVQGVFQVFRRRLSLKQAILFANILPVGLRALFVTDWDTDEPIQPFGTHESMTLEVKALRHKHNFSTDTAIEDVAGALRQHVDIKQLETVLSHLPEGASKFWGLVE